MPRTLNNDKHLVLRAPVRIVRELERRADLAGVTRSEFIRRALVATVATPAGEPARK